MSGPTAGLDHDARTNGLAGNGISAAASTAANTAAGAAPSSPRCAHRPATSVHHVSAAACICATDVNSRPRQKLSRM